MVHLQDILVNIQIAVKNFLICNEFNFIMCLQTLNKVNQENAISKMSSRVSPQ